METQKSPIKDMASIAIRLTITCLLAAVVIGLTFVFTSDAKKKNEQAKQDKTMYALLGYDAKTNPVPETVAMHHLYRYVITEGESQFIGYLLPTDAQNASAYTFVTLSLEGDLVDQKPITAEPARLYETTDRDAIIQAVMPENRTFRFADGAVVVTENGKRKAYLLEGKFPGFKNFIGVMIALDAQFSILGLEIMEHEEDPGLGGEIEQKYFKNQFIGKTFDRLSGLTVEKTPLPDDYYNALEGKIQGEPAEKAMATHANDNIYALTGATISSRFVTEGVKNMVTKFSYRIHTLDTALGSQNIQVAF